MKQVSKEFQLQCMRDLDNSKMPIGDFLATMLHGNWQDYGETEKEYKDGATIELQYEERTDSFEPDSSSVQINVEIPHTITHHWDQRR